MNDPIAALATSLRDRYVIDREIGAGGMATVYLARDVKHDRNVALKVLRPDLGAVLGVERFLAEIRVTANLQHPNLLPLFDSGESDGLLFYVMPFVEGESLRARLEREKQLPVDEAIHIAAAIASALDHAHRHGVIHRDLKPENILLQSGEPVIADFGIALAVSNAGAGRVTQTGISLGTPQYMSPEQATGDRVIDGRTDIYSLGAMLFEMLAGDPPHHGSTSQAVIAKVLTEKSPSVRTLRPTVPAHVDATIARALEKLPADRFATAREFAESLSGRVAAYTGATTSLPGATRTGRRMFAPVPMAIGLVAGAVIAGGALVLTRADPPPPRITRFAIELGDPRVRQDQGGTSFSLSHDGTMVVYAGGTGDERGIYIRALDRLESTLITRAPEAVTPRFSPDDRSIYFINGSGAQASVRKIAREGGAITTLVDAGSIAFWADDGSIILVRPGIANRGLWRTRATGGQPQLVAAPDTARGETAITRPFVLPGSAAAVVEIRRLSDMDSTIIGVVRLSDGEIIRLNQFGVNPLYVNTGHIVFTRPDGNVFAVPFDARALRTTGEAFQIMQGLFVKSGGAAELAISTNGTMIYMEGSAPVERIGRLSALGSFVPYSRMPDQRYSMLRMSPDEKRIALVVGGDGTPATESDIWIFEIASGTLTRFTTGGKSSRPEWTPDGRRIVWRYQDGGQSEVRWQPWDKSSDAEVFMLRDTDPLKSPIGVSFSRVPNALFAWVTAGTGAPSDIGLASFTAPRNPKMLIATKALEKTPRLSPDGKWLAYASSESGTTVVYVRPFPGPGGRFQISEQGGNAPMWSRSSQQVVYHTPQGTLVRAALAFGSDVTVTKRDTLLRRLANPGLNWANYDVAADGSLIIARGASDVGRTVVVTNWFEELKARAREAAR